jgi:hypothetical protein
VANVLDTVTQNFISHGLHIIIERSIHSYLLDTISDIIHAVLLTLVCFSLTLFISTLVFITFINYQSYTKSNMKAHI